MASDGVLPVFETKQRIHIVGRAISRFRKEDYTSLYEILFRLENEVQAKFMERACFKNHVNVDFEIRWNVTETLFFDEESQNIPDAFPMLQVMCQLVHAQNLWIYRTCPYIINISDFGIHLKDNFSSAITMNATAIPEIVAGSIRV